jgi:hypothetical protein
MPTGKFTSGKGLVALLAAAGLVLSSASLASAEESDPNSATEVIDASPVVGETPLAADQANEVVGNVVVVESAQSSVSVTLPVSANAEKTLDQGVVVLSGNESSSIVPVKLADGSVAIHSVLNDANAPKTYRYTFDTNEGTTLVPDEDSGAVIAVNADGGADFFVAPPWATDANGDPVPTRYTVEGNALIQHIDFDASTAFPVVADPWAGIDLVASFTWSYISGSGYRLNIQPTLHARSFTGNLVWYQAVGEAGWSELYNKMLSTQRYRMNASAKGQYICHMGFAGFDAAWNLEVWKPAKHAGEWVNSGCN